MLKSINRRPQHLDTMARWFIIPIITPPTLITTATTDKIELVVVESISTIKELMLSMQSLRDLQN